ncbi:MAG: aspartate kinase [Bacteroidetes bacterium]|nr:MAG: aspartate kinase [Bacteroidota bacterium]
MKVFKFGGASLKDAENILNVVNIIQNFGEAQKLLVVVSAMGKTTNAIEDVLKKYWNNENYEENVEILEKYHFDIIYNLMKKDAFTPKDVEDLKQTFQELRKELKKWQKHSHKEMVYDQIVSYGEIISSKIIFNVLKNKKINIEWLDARKIIRTDATWREGRVDWEQTQKNMQYLRPTLDEKIVITQGFIGRTAEGHTTTLGREGSDYTGAIFSAGLSAESQTIWKDVAGVLNADPKQFSFAALFDKLSYEESASLTYYGASVIHPKTIAPLRQAGIPLLVKSFLQPQNIGTYIGEIPNQEDLKAVIVKEKQVWLAFRPTTWQYLREEEVADILTACSGLALKVNLICKGAFILNILTEDRPEKLALLANRFSFQQEKNCVLFTKMGMQDFGDLWDKSKGKVLLELKEPDFQQFVVQF